MDTHRLLLLLLLLTTMMMMMPVSVLAYKSPFRGELNAVPRGLDVLLGNVASQTSDAKRRGSGNDLVDRPTDGKQLASSHNVRVLQMNTVVVLQLLNFRRYIFVWNYA